MCLVEAPFELDFAPIGTIDLDEFTRFRVHEEFSQLVFPLASFVFVHTGNMQTLNFLLKVFVIDELLLGYRLLTAGTTRSDTKAAHRTCPSRLDAARSITA